MRTLSSGPSRRAARVRRRGVPFRMVSCSRTYHPAYPSSSTALTIAAMSTSPSPSSTYMPPPRPRCRSPPGLHATCPVEADVLEVDVGDAVGVGLRDGHGVTAADEEVPGVEAEPDAAAREDRSVSSPLSTMVPTWGCRVAFRPRTAAASRSRSRLPSKVSQPASSSTGGRRTLGPSLRPAPPWRPGGDEPVHRALDLGERVVLEVVQDDRHELAHACSPWAARVSALACGSAGRKSSGPNSVAARPRSLISDSTVSTSYCQPQPGTSHTPHEMGAPAMRCSRGRMVVLTGSRSPPGARRAPRDGTARTPRRCGRPASASSRCRGRTAAPGDVREPPARPGRPGGGAP